jgi:tRNA nucleotidyltransferase/poly(A) polymerase
MRQLLPGQIRSVLAFLRYVCLNTEWEGRVLAAGGVVRDRVMGRTGESKDIDLVVLPEVGSGIEFAEWFAAHYPQKLTSPLVTFPRFGTVKMGVSGVEVECVGPRGETYTDEDGRYPEVRTATLREDARRRDCTANALYMDVCSGAILDFVGGVKDITHGVIRTELDPSVIFTDDPLRMLRVGRFAHRFGWRIDPGLLAALQHHAALITTVSVERQMEEVRKMLERPDADEAIEILRRTHLLKYVLGPIAELIMVGQNKYHQHDVYMHTLDVMRHAAPTYLNQLCALFHDCGKPLTRTEDKTGIHFRGHEETGAHLAATFLEAMKCPRSVVECVFTVTRHHMRLKNSGPRGELVSDKALRKFVLDLGEHLEIALDVMHADNCSHAEGYCQPDQIPGIRARIEKLNSVAPTTHVTLPISGVDVMRVLGIPPGKAVGDALEKVKDAWLEDPTLTAEQALAIVTG